MTEIKLEKRYPHSRVEDINDAFIRGYWQGYEKGSSNAAQELEKAVMKMLDKDTNVRSKTEPQTDIHDFTDCDFCKDRNCKDCEGGKDEPQTDCSWK